MLNDGLILGLGSPLMDIISKVDSELLEKYQLKSNSTVLSDGNHSKIFQELNKNEIIYLPGGSPQNTLRVLSGILKHPNVATFMGAVGNDENALEMERAAREDGLNLVYEICESYETGTCTVLITGKERSLVTNPGAANHFSFTFLKNNWSYVEQAEYFYVSSFFFMVNHESIIHLARYSHEKDRTFILNLSAPFLCKRYKQEILEILPYVDIIFGNNEEFTSFYEALEIEHYLSNSLENFSKLVSNLFHLKSKKRIVVITQGQNPVIHTIGTSTLHIEVKQIKNENIIDTNGAGDAFVGGYLSQYVKKETIEKCIDCAIWSASQIIQQTGCKIPKDFKYK